jgi:hypothetical protein
MLADFRVVNRQETLKLIHFSLEDLELINKELFEVSVHQVVENPVSRFKLSAFDEKVSGDIVHPLTISNVLVADGICF